MKSAARAVEEATPSGIAGAIARLINPASCQMKEIFAARAADPLKPVTNRPFLLHLAGHGDLDRAGRRAWRG